MIVLPAFTSQEDVDAGDAIANTSFSNLFNSCANGAIIASPSRFEINDRAGEQTNSAGASDRDSVFVGQLFHELPPFTCT